MVEKYLEREAGRLVGNAQVEQLGHVLLAEHGRKVIKAIAV